MSGQREGTGGNKKPPPGGAAVWLGWLGSAVPGAAGCKHGGEVRHTVSDESHCPPQLTGYEYEVLETADCIRKGLLECPSMPHRDTIRMLELMDHLRAQMGIRYPCEGVDEL